MSERTDAFQKAKAGQGDRKFQITLSQDAAQWLLRSAEELAQESGQSVTPNMVASGIIESEYRLALEDE